MAIIVLPIHEMSKLVLTILGSASGLGALLYWVLQKKLETHFAARLENIRHGLQLEQQKMAVVYNHQKDSFRNVITAMHSGLKALEKRNNYGEWSPIQANEADACAQAIAAERLFLDSESDHALGLFLEVMWAAVNTEPDEPAPESSDVAECHTQMKLILDRLVDHFRDCVGLTPESSDPLLDVEALGAYRLVNRFHFSGFTLQANSPLKSRPGETAAEMIKLASENVHQLNLELERLKDAILSTDKTFFFHILPEIDRYKSRLNKLVALEGIARRERNGGQRDSTRLSHESDASHCHRCGGAGTVPCPKCEGAGLDGCPVCNGSGCLECPKCSGSYLL
jgi:hypothetical protein